VLSVVFAASCALIWGVGDFSGGKAAQRANPLTVALLSETFGLPVVIAFVAVTWHGLPSAADLAWGAAAGVAGFGGIALFYRALASGAMAIVAPITATTSAALPFAIGLIIDRTPSPLALAGAALAVVAIALVSVGHNASDAVRATPRVVGMALAAGALFGLFFALLRQATDESGAWPALAVRLAGVAAGLVAVFLTGTGVKVGSIALRWVLVAGVFDVVANVLYLLALRDGVLSVVAPIASLYPASTVVLALLVDRERIRPLQVAGLGLAAAALVLTAT
jgi:drug/metabolite transporter (DMT)-like permease